MTQLDVRLSLRAGRCYTPPVAAVPVAFFTPDGFARAVPPAMRNSR
jgi:hypothetical protein